MLAALAPVVQDVSFPGFEGITLKGTWVRPSGAPKAPVVVLLPGSGPTDRDGNALQVGVRTDLLKQIAESLAARGIASLRFDKRATPGYRDIWPKSPDQLDRFFRYEAFVGDAEAAVNYVRTRSDADKARIGIVGHSEGALYALAIGSKLAGTPRRLSAIVLLSAAGRPMDAVIMDQLRFRLPKQVPPDQVKTYLDYATRAMQASRQGQPFPPNPPMGLGSLFNPSVRSLMHSYIVTDPVALAKGYDGAALVVNGEFDNQVSATKDGIRLYEALKSRKNGYAERVVVKAGHNLKATPSIDADVFEGPVVPMVLSRMGAFLAKRL